MQITVDIPDAALTEAKARGLTPEVYVRGLVEDAMQTVSTKATGPQGKRNMETFFEVMAAHSDKIPQLPDEAFSRESFYQDHD